MTSYDLSSIGPCHCRWNCWCQFDIVSSIHQLLMDHQKHFTEISIKILNFFLKKNSFENVCKTAVLLLGLFVCRLRLISHKSHCGDKRVIRPFYLHNGISYPDQTASFYMYYFIVAEWCHIRFGINTVNRLETIYGGSVWYCTGGV